MTRVAAVQMCSTPDRGENLEQAERLLREALDQGAEWVAFPENFTLLTENREDRFAQSDASVDGPLTTQLRSFARQYGAWILAGSVPFRTEGKDQRVTNTSLLLDPEGRIVARYDKIHLFDVQLSEDRTYRESESIQPGESPVAVTTPIGRVGLTICYDMRFPELFRTLSAQQPVDVFFIPSAFTRFTGAAHWDPLTRVRAIENQAYVIAPAQSGTHYQGRESHGHTRIIDPWGRVLAERAAGSGVVVADLDGSLLEKVRSELPSLRHRRIS